MGTGGGGEVWCVADRYTGEECALKVLAYDATASEMDALIAEATALSGLAGLGVPEVRQFGRLPLSGRSFLVRDMVDGKSLQDVIESGEPLSKVLLAVVLAAEQLTHVHRAGFFHGDIKPANIIVAATGKATLVDLGLAAPWKDSGVAARGLTPKYAAPELMEGGPLTARAEVYALGATLGDVLERCENAGDDAELVHHLRGVWRRATSADSLSRYPSADEFAAALRRVASLTTESTGVPSRALWPVVGIDVTFNRLHAQVTKLKDGTSLLVQGELGSGRSTLLRRLTWSLGAEGCPLVWIEGAANINAAQVSAELAQYPEIYGVRVVVDDAGQLSPENAQLISNARDQGAVVVFSGDGALAATSLVFEVPGLGERVALNLVQRAIPSLTEPLAKLLITAASSRPGELRRLLGLLEAETVVTQEDIERVARGIDAPQSVLPEEPLLRAETLLDRGRYKDAKAVLDAVDSSEPLRLNIALARLHVGLGNADTALRLMNESQSIAQSAPDALRRQWQLWSGRARVGVSDYDGALEMLQSVAGESSSVGFEALAYKGLALFYLGQEGNAASALDEAVSVASGAGEHRIEALALACLGFLQQRTDNYDAARETYRRAIAAAQVANDAGTQGTAQLNLAGVLQLSGDVAGALESYEAAVDMGKRSGRAYTLLQGLLNLANVDLYLGRIARARSSIDALEAQRHQLSGDQLATLAGCKADLHIRSGELELAMDGYLACAEEFKLLGRPVDAAEARLEATIAGAGCDGAELNKLSNTLAQAKAELGDSAAHRPLQSLATARVQMLEEDEVGARDSLDSGLRIARELGKKEDIWRILEARAEVETQGGQHLLAKRDREEALTVLEEIAARLPRDLREVFWNDGRRRSLRNAVEAAAPAAAQFSGTYAGAERFGSRSSISTHTRTPLEQSLARILEINGELLGELDIGRLTARVTEYAVDLLRAERGFVLLQQPSGTLTVHTSRTRAGDQAHAEFSRSIAQRVLASGEPVVSVNARQDARMKGFQSVHQLMLEAIACVPIASRGAPPIGALYIEARHDRGRSLERDVPTLRAFADQVALALDTAQLVSENRQRAEQLAKANEELEGAKAELKELLGERTKKLQVARQRLRDARETLYGHFGYRGIVGTSAPMRKLYALVDRVRETDVPVLITGESGTGKELVARAIHEGSPRKARPFLGVNCAAIPEHLLESELFGNVRGAFTGADRERKGVIREASTGSLLLDEIGEMPQKMQAGLLRVLQEQKVRPVGGASEQDVDVRMIFATHRDLAQMVEQNRFREDLYYRIHVVQVQMPPLRERLDDIPLLVDHFLGLFSARYKRERRLLSRAALRRMMEYSWPGNVRQMEHVLLNAWILSEGDEVDADDIDIPDSMPRSSQPGSSMGLADSRDSTPPRSSPASVPPSSLGVGSSGARKNDERQRMLEALERHNWNRVKAAEDLGMPRRTFYRRLREYDIQ